MTLRSRSVHISFCAALTLLAGCGKDDKETARFNEGIGGRGPITVSGIDLGLLQDPSAYKPAAAGGGALGTGGEAAGATPTGGGGEADTARKAVTGVFESVTSLTAASVLDSFDPAQIQALTEVDFTSSLQTVFDAFSQVAKTVQSKVGEAQKSAMDELPTQLNNAITAAMEITIVDPETATATLDPAKIQSSLQTWAQDLAAKFGTPAAPPAAGGETPGRVAPPEAPGGTPPEGTTPETPTTPPGGDPFAAILGGAPAGGAHEPAKIPLKKIDGQWRIQLPSAVSKEVAEVLKEGCEITHELLSELNRKLDPIPANDEQAMQAAVMSMMPMAMGQYTGWFQKLQAALAEGAAAAPGGEKKPEEGEKKEEQPADSSRIINP